MLSSGQDVATHLPDQTGAELLHSSLSSQEDTFTICSRFITYQFTHHGYRKWPSQVLLQVGNYVLLESKAMTEENPSFKSEAGDLWQNGDILQVDSFGTKEKISWSPGAWNSFCIVLSLSKKTFNTMFNGKTLVVNRSFAGYNFDEKKNVRIMARHYPNTGETWYALFGAMTDVNIWNRSLSQSEVEQWSRCELGAGGNLLDWNTAQWKAVGLQQREMEGKEICKNQKEQVLISFIELRDLESSQGLCRRLGGEIAVAKDERAGRAMRMAVKRLGGIWFYTGYTDRQEKGVWLDINTGEPATIEGWSEGEPNNSGGDEHCTMSNVETGKTNDEKCSYEVPSLCFVNKTTSYHLQGTCQNSYIDRYYVLQSARKLAGYIQTQMIWSEENSRWEIVNLLTTTVAAYFNETSDLPLGSHQWHFQDGSGCKDPGRKGKMHKLWHWSIFSSDCFSFV